MKINEFIEKVNKVAYARKGIDDVAIYNYKYCAHSDYFFELKDLKEKKMSYSADWSACDLAPDELLNVLQLINEISDTPLEERFAEKKWHLNMGQDEYGNDIYLMNVVGSPKQLRTSLAVSNEFTTFTDSDLVKLKEQYPRLAPAIDAMKEPVEDDDD